MLVTNYYKQVLEWDWVEVRCYQDLNKAHEMAVLFSRGDTCEYRIVDNESDMVFRKYGKR